MALRGRVRRAHDVRDRGVGCQVELGRGVCAAASAKLRHERFQLFVRGLGQILERALGGSAAEQGTEEQRLLRRGVLLIL